MRIMLRECGCLTPMYVCIVIIRINIVLLLSIFCYSYTKTLTLNYWSLAKHQRLGYHNVSFLKLVDLHSHAFICLIGEFNLLFSVVAFDMSYIHNDSYVCIINNMHTRKCQLVLYIIYIILNNETSDIKKIKRKIWWWAYLPIWYTYCSNINRDITISYLYIHSVHK